MLRNPTPSDPTTTPTDLRPGEHAFGGIVVRAHGLWYEVIFTDGPHTGQGIIATIRGALKKHRRRTDIVAVGDRVLVVELPDNEGAIVSVAPRHRTLVRTARNTRDTDQVILANLDQVLFVFAIADPTPHPRMLDRFIILAEKQGIPIRIVINKCELNDPSSDASIDARFGVYRDLYSVHVVSAAEGIGIAELRAALLGKTSALAGPSGVGKSSLLNAIDPEHRRDVGQVSGATGKGRHTTIGSRLYEIDDNTWVADTPGMRALAMHAVDPDHLDDYFIEFRPFLGACFYQDCTHTHEPGCPVKDAVAAGDISQERYDSYVAIRSGTAFNEEAV